MSATAASGNKPNAGYPRTLMVRAMRREDVSEHVANAFPHVSDEVRKAITPAKAEDLLRDACGVVATDFQHRLIGGVALLDTCDDSFRICFAWLLDEYQNTGLGKLMAYVLMAHQVALHGGGPVRFVCRTGDEHRQAETALLKVGFEETSGAAQRAGETVTRQRSGLWILPEYRLIEALEAALLLEDCSTRMLSACGALATIYIDHPLFNLTKLRLELMDQVRKMKEMARGDAPPTAIR
jgi:RimJ/RimL family protein N-acetyltransferase